MKKSLFSVIVFAKINVKRYFRDKTALFFTILFPLIFLFIFGGIFGHNSNVSFNVALFNQSSSTVSKSFIQEIKSSSTFKIKPGISNLSVAKQELSRSEIDAAIVFPSNFGQVKNNLPSGQIVVYYDENNAQAAQTLATVLEGAVTAPVNAKYVNVNPPFTVVTKSTNQAGLTQFDYVFSGLLGFSIIGLGIFGPVNVFPELKKQGVLRRIHISPLRVWQYFMSNVLSQAVIGLISVGIMFIVAVTVFHLKMHGSYPQLAAFVLIGIFLIFGIGLAIGGWAKNENQAAPLANIIVFPLMFLTGVFFPTYLMPEWLQHVSTFLPLTPVIDGMRMIITENKGLLELGPQLGLIGIWAVIIYAIAFRVFRWE
ncbi:MAG TPA: ABC transporter permease [Candidatus Saccharimonadales bacterium]|nr:ABC transporter permease [Candidatus Saccharimonadales bacterium]